MRECLYVTSKGLRWTVHYCGDETVDYFTHTYVTKGLKRFLHLNPICLYEQTSVESKKNTRMAQEGSTEVNMDDINVMIIDYLKIKL